MYKKNASSPPQPVLGKMQKRPAILDRQLAHDLKNLRGDDDPFSVTVGKTMCTYDFYEGEAQDEGGGREKGGKEMLMRRILMYMWVNFFLIQTP